MLLQPIFGLAQHAFVWDYYYFISFFFFFPLGVGEQEAEDKAVNC